ncbi:endonuclease/exonuclease/phosphatase family protein [Nocardiopsis changdeensis]|uniref:Endonuclease/exonuclease/phosphatase family protein n=1 Tax=Nocardiopsis changdeensis TaxID=2831969 RepID=A0ABX8BYE8_9ACTN|nr:MULTISPECIES: endonuclease/exonuclease/phosphatase family protein [Nocardiopsis]QUX26152.1 endonuclease/exonuclease/phosphatase family protein [Nocardiopsis changdeensis]QYX39941.1 endonuclease/exonuclease/phosphatase family protein [Nocardiopsis sp. MT53]
MVLASEDVPAAAPAVAVSPSVPPPVPAGSVRFATFNTALSRQRPGAMASALASGGWRLARAVAETVQRVRPDVLLVNEFDHDPTGRALELFVREYLERGWNGSEGVEFPHVFTAPVNTGVASGQDLDGDGRVVVEPGSDAYAGDAFGFGRFPGQYGMAVLSRYPLDAERARTFRLLPRAAMPGALVPVDPASGEPFLSPRAWAAARLSSKSHWDLPVDTGWGRPVHLLASHPTPPAFDGPERRNVLRNHDEIRFWADYLTPGADGYVRDDAGTAGGLAPDAPFVLAGDLNADPRNGSSLPGAIDRLLAHPRVADPLPHSQGGRGRAGSAAGAPGHGDAFTEDTPPGHLRVDYVLPSRDLAVGDRGVFWPAPDDPLARLAGAGPPFPVSDHRLVWVDVSR